MKNLIKSFVLLIAISFASCNTEVEDHVTGNAKEGGALVKITKKTGKVLGAPLSTDLDNSEISFTDNEMDLEVSLQFGGETVTKYEIVKSLNGGTESVVATAANLPLSVVYTTLAEFYANTQVTDATELRVGDVFTFKTKMYTPDGIFYADKGTYAIKVACSSDLAADYDVVTVRDDGAQYDQGIESIVEIAPGRYTTQTTGGWSQGQLRPFQGFIFEDSCKSITLPPQTLFDFYSNKVYQTDAQIDESYVDESGNMHIKYTIEFSDGDRSYISDYTKQ